MRIVPTLAIVAALIAGMAGCKGKSAPAPAQTDARDSGAGATNSPSVRNSSAGNDDANVEEAAEGDEQRVQAALAKTSDTRPVLVCFGDSLTAGLGTGAGQSYPDYLQEDLDAQGFHYRVANLGVSGNTTKDGVARLNDVLGLKPRIAVVEFGGNDGLRGLPVSDSEANLDQIVQGLKGAGVKVVLAGITLPPDYGEDYIRQFDGMYSSIAKKYDVPMLPFLLKNVYGVPGMMQKDETHATAEGNKIVARNVLGLVRPLLKKK